MVGSRRSAKVLLLRISGHNCPREVQIERVEGDKDVMNGADDVPHPDGDGPPDASVQAGSLRLPHLMSRGVCCDALRKQEQLSPHSPVASGEINFRAE